MTLVVTSGFPRDMPERADGLLPFAAASFDPLYSQATNPTRGGQMQVANLGADLWSMKFSTHILSYIDALDYLAWLQSLRGGARLFKAWHPLLKYPIAYPSGFAALTRAGGGAFDGTVTVTAIGASRDTLSLSTLPAAFLLNRGDMISMVMGTSRTLHRIIEAATASGGGTVTVTVEPTLPLAAVASVSATFLKPWCLAVVEANSIKGPFQPGQVGTVEFSAVQTY